MNFPNDIDGDVMRSLEENGFNFENETEVEFNIDFKHWPLNNNDKAAIVNLYPNCEFVDPSEMDIENGDLLGYVQIYLTRKIEHEFIVNTQKTLTSKVEQYGGWCDSWGVSLG
ncbi:MAG: ribonuclease E inhibitor RraB [Moritella sp.]|uniref:ribonuclease E inhibitor RraB n=1 Tax=Moritella sp. TaxID=78556 RepID=UPI0029A3B651|nr:ribonuclease E inhibitor RraB [Moritella sp.]MDX2322195.1 ribonuclease E inhibitor RraB [Moritella sp.]